MKEVNIEIRPLGDSVLLSARDWNKVVRWLKAHEVRVEIGNKPKRTPAGKRGQAKGKKK